MDRLGESLTMYLTKSMAGSERRPVASTSKMARCWGTASKQTEGEARPLLDGCGEVTTTASAQTEERYGRC